MDFRNCWPLVVLVMAGSVSGVMAQPPQPAPRVVRAEPDRILLTDFRGELTPDYDPGAMLIISRDVFFPRVHAEATRSGVLVTLSPEMVEAIDAVGPPSSGRPPFLVIDQLTLGGRSYHNLTAPVPTALQLRLVDGVVQTLTLLDIDYMPAADQERARSPEAWLATIGGRPFPILQVTLGFGDSPFLVLRIGGALPHGASATLSFRQAPNAEPRLVATGTTPGTRIGNLSGYADIYTGFTFSQSQPAGRPSARRRSTFGVITRFERFSQLTGFASPNQLSAGPRVAVKTNSSDQDDEDSLLLSFPFAFTRHRGVGTKNTPAIRSITFNLGPSLESEKTFKNRNLIAAGNLDFRFSTRGIARRYPVDLRPYVGFEIGQRIWQQPGDALASAPGAVRRLKGGLTIRTALDFRKPYLQRVVLDAEYVYRQLFTDELLLVNRKSIEQIDHGSRSYLNLAVRFAFNPYWELFTLYAQGELPPRFGSVHKIQAGLAFRLNAQY